MPKKDYRPPETDPRFPSGPWVGYFQQRHEPAGKHGMELVLNFRHGDMSGSGRDRFGLFKINGQYSLETGRCIFKKSYKAGYSVDYNGFNENNGIWGTWLLPDAENHGCGDLKGGFHIWPEGEEATEDNSLTAIESPELVPA